jgi:hypothetical protein
MSEALNVKSGLDIIVEEMNKNEFMDVVIKRKMPDGSFVDASPASMSVLSTQAKVATQAQALLGATKEERTKWAIEMKNYANAFGKRKENTDLVLVDGRFRVACALKVCLELPSSTVIVHDFYNRVHYHGILPYFDVIESVETLAVLKPKAIFDRQECATLLNKHYNDFR